jgi:hypothetical protein
VRVAQAQSSGFVERLHKDLDASVVSYNTKPPHLGRGLKLAPKLDLSQEKKEVKMNSNKSA